MIEFIVGRGQSVFDVALYWYGHVEGMEWIIQDNKNIELHTVAEGDVLQIRKGQYKDKTVALYYQRGITPTTD
jgi:hypothetical protein